MAKVKKLKRRAKRPAPPKNRFRVGETYQCKHSGKVFRIERFESPFGERYLLRSLESGHPGTPKNVFFLNLQIEDGELVKVRKPVDHTKLRHLGETAIVYQDPRSLRGIPA